ncbi:DUF2207 family protein [Trueperella bonasi]|nr:DUF2207 domain-containing protein [Trueperella bonasi]
MKKIWIALLVLFAVVGIAPAAAANVISDIAIEAEILADGSAVITDTRTFTANEGSEHYISLENLGPSDVVGFSVVLNGHQLEDVGEWDVDRSRLEKAGKSGVVTLYDGYELAFGFGDYGTHTAVMTYTVTNFVENLEDGAQAVYWEFIPKNMTRTENVTIRLTSAEGVTFNQENSRIWGFGFEGETEITPEALVMRTTAEITARDYMTLLAIFPQAPFTSTVTMPHTSESLEARAKEGSIWEDDPDGGDSPTRGWKDSGTSRKSPDFDWKEIISGLGKGLSSMVGLLFWSIVLFFGFEYYKKDKNKQISQHEARGLFSFGAKPTVGKEDYWREVPYQGPVADVVAVASSALPGLATALLLQWIKDGALREVQHVSGWVFKREEAAFRIEGTPVFRSDVERTYWDFIVRAARDDATLQRKEIEKFTRRNSDSVGSWQSSARAYSREKLKEQGLVETFETTTFGLFTRTHTRINQEGMELKNRIQGFKNYLRDFSLLNERGASNVLLWDEYMIWAGFLGIAEEVARQFNIVDPTYTQATSITQTSTVISHDFSNHMESTYKSAISRSSSSSSSSGGGGRSSSSGGGGGARGGGSGGGIR